MCGLGVVDVADSFSNSPEYFRISARNTPPHLACSASVQQRNLPGRYQATIPGDGGIVSVDREGAYWRDDQSLNVVDETIAALGELPPPLRISFSKDNFALVALATDERVRIVHCSSSAGDCAAVELNMSDFRDGRVNHD
jgi:hypothetical protein